MTPLFPRPESPLDGAIFGNGNDPTSSYRYALWRTPDPTNPRTLVVIGCNPSTANATEDDPTIRRCVRFALDSRHGKLVMLNCFAYRATDVRTLAEHPGPIGETTERFNFGDVNVGHIRRECRQATTIVCAWGSKAKLPRTWMKWPAQLAAMLRAEGLALHVLRLTKAGDPEHPLYLPASCRPVPWMSRGPQPVSHPE